MASVTWCQTTGFKLVFNEWLSGDVLRRTGSTAVLVCLTYKYKQRPQGQRSGPCYHRCSEFYKFNLLRKQFLSFVSEWPEIFCLIYYSENRKSQYICVNSLDLLPLTPLTPPPWMINVWVDINSRASPFWRRFLLLSSHQSRADLQMIFNHLHPHFVCRYFTKMYVNIKTMQYWKTI